MILALVRLSTSHHIIGVYSAKTLPNLRDLVDETCTPSQCEYHLVPEGGFVARNAEDRDVFAPTSCLERILFNQASDEQAQWHPLDPDAEAIGSRLDALLATQTGRNILARSLPCIRAVTLAPAPSWKR